MAKFDKLVRLQGNRCALYLIGGCNGPLVQDHSYRTRKIRGVLCRKHNSGIGLLGDEVDGILIALDYLRKYEVTTKAA
jgi:hypothetical protein